MGRVVGCDGRVGSGCVGIARAVIVEVLGGVGSGGEHERVGTVEAVGVGIDVKEVGWVGCGEKLGCVGTVEAVSVDVDVKTAGRLGSGEQRERVGTVERIVRRDMGCLGK
jgi:hypothetical protein